MSEKLYLYVLFVYIYMYICVYMCVCVRAYISALGGECHRLSRFAFDLVLARQAPESPTGQASLPVRAMLEEKSASDLSWEASKRRGSRCHITKSKLKSDIHCGRGT